jgi:hypothetical protein
VVRYAYPAIAALAVDAIEVERIRAVIRATSEVLSVTLRVRRRIEAILDDATEGLAEFENEADDG